MVCMKGGWGGFFCLNMYVYDNFREDWRKKLYILEKKFIYIPTINIHIRKEIKERKKRREKKKKKKGGEIEIESYKSR